MRTARSANERTNHEAIETPTQSLNLFIFHHKTSLKEAKINTILKHGPYEGAQGYH